MKILAAILIISFVLIVLMFTVTMKIMFRFDSEESDINLTLLWLYPILKAVIAKETTGLVLYVYLFNKSIICKPLKARNQKSNKLELVRRVNPTEVKVDAFYGFRDPFVTGIACGAINIASQYINIDSVSQTPNFVSDKDYIYVDATAKVNMGSAIVNLLKK